MLVNTSTTIGPSASGTAIDAEEGNVYNFTVSFPQGVFTAAPVVVVTALQTPDPTTPMADTFTVTLTSVTATGFAVNVYRTDDAGAGWEENLQLQWIASS